MVVELQKSDQQEQIGIWMGVTKEEAKKGGTYDNLSGDCLSHKVLRTPTELRLGLAYPKSGYNTSSNGSVFFFINNNIGENY